eukprot:gene3103-5273_t
MNVEGVFVYGTLRPDYTTKGDHWGIIDKDCIWKYAHTTNFTIFQNKTEFYPFAVKSNNNERIYGIIITWKDIQIFKKKLKLMDEIEGYDEKAKDNWYEREIVECFTKEGNEKMKCYIYYQNSIHSDDCLFFESGNWLNKY